MENFGAFIAERWVSIVNIVSSIRFKDIIDILVVAVGLYYVIRFIRERRAGKLALGLVLLFALQIVSDLFSLVAMQFIMKNLFQVGVIALIILFQPELRSALEKVGGGSLRGLKSITETKSSAVSANEPMIDAVCEAACEFSKEKTGSLIVFERETKLGDVIASGVTVNAEVTPFLLRNIFFNKAPLHDGAVVIRDRRIYAAGCFLPLSTNLDIVKDLGTRHRAAIGMSENSDALVLVVSEETGTISLAVEGRLYRSLDYSSLKKLLTELLAGTDINSDALRFVRQFRKKGKSERADSAETSDGEENTERRN